MAITQATYLNETTPQRAGLVLALVIALHIAVVAILVSLDLLPQLAPPAMLMARVIQASPKQLEITPAHARLVTSKSVIQSHPDAAPERLLLSAEAQAPAAVAIPAAIAYASSLFDMSPLPRLRTARFSHS